MQDKNSTPAKDHDTQIADQHLHLNPEYTFKNFVVGKSNQFAYFAAKSICIDDENHYNPFVIIGGSGLGKSHLAQSIGIV